MVPARRISVSESLWKIRDARPTDASRLAVLAEETFREAYAGHDVDEYCAGAFGPEMQHHELADNKFMTIVVESGG
jgi:diamine N-acetyltransferase